MCAEKGDDDILFGSKQNLILKSFIKFDSCSACDIIIIILDLHISSVRLNQQASFSWDNLIDQI